MSSLPCPVHAPCVLGLELIGVFAVVLFHVWPSEFCNGFMGADILFVISGFLLADHLVHFPSDDVADAIGRPMSASKSTGKLSAFIRTICRFFSGELSRILPVFLLAILFSLLAGFVFLFDNGLQKLHEDALWALCFGTNHQLTDVEWTFELIGVPQSRPLLHLWVVAVQVQNLLVLCPLVLLLLRLFTSSSPSSSSSSSFLRPLPLPFPTILLLSSLLLLALPSFLLWLFSTSKSLTMGWALARTWQFLLGSMASAAIIRPNLTETGKIAPTRLGGKVSNFRIVLAILGHFLFYVLVLCLSLLFFLPSMFWPQFFQFKTILTIAISIGTAFLLYFYTDRLKRASPPTLLANWLCANFAQLPFVFFVLHQPLATFFRSYIDVSLLDIPNGLVALALISSVSLLTQQFFHHFLGHFRPFLVRLILFGYASCVLLALAPNAINFSQEKIEHQVPMFIDTRPNVQMVPLGVDSVRSLLEQLQIEERRAELVPRLHQAEKVRINEMLKSSFTFDIDVPGTATDLFVRENHFQEDNRHVQRIYEWMLKGNGTGGVLVFGNSHAQVAWREVELALKTNYSWFHVVSVPGCMPLFEQDWRTIYSVRCGQTVRGLLNLLEKKRPDKLFLIFRWYDELRSMPLENPIEKDPTLAQMQSFMDKVQKFVAHRIYLSAPNLQFDAEIAHQLAKRIWQNSPLEGLDKNYTTHLEDNKWSYARVSHLKCPKCTVFDLAEEFCDPEANVCHAFDPDVQLAYFSDVNHISYLGRLRARKMFEKLIH